MYFYILLFFKINMCDPECIMAFKYYFEYLLNMCDITITEVGLRNISESP